MRRILINKVRGTHYWGEALHTQGHALALTRQLTSEAQEGGFIEKIKHHRYADRSRIARFVRTIPQSPDYIRCYALR